MSMVFVGMTKDPYSGRETEMYIDTDDLSDEDYHEYWELKKRNKEKDKANGITRSLGSAYDERQFLLKHI